MVNGIVVFLDRVIFLILVERNCHLPPHFFFPSSVFIIHTHTFPFVLSKSDQPYINTRFVQSLIRSALFPGFTEECTTFYETVTVQCNQISGSAIVKCNIHIETQFPLQIRR